MDCDELLGLTQHKRVQAVAQEGAPVLSLPPELLAHILKLTGAGIKDRLTVYARVSRQFREAALDFTNWVTLDLREVACPDDRLPAVVLRMLPHARDVRLSARSLNVQKALHQIKLLAKDLRRLDVWFADVDVADLAALFRRFPMLTSFSAQGSRLQGVFGDAMLSSDGADNDQEDGIGFPVMPHMRALDVSHLSLTTEDGPAWMVETAPSLWYLDMDDCVGNIGSDTVVAIVSRASCLVFASLDGQDCDDALLIHLCLSNPSLQFISVSFCEEFTDQGLMAIAHLESLRRLCLKKAHNVPAGTVDRLFTTAASTLRNITHIDFSEMGELSDQDVSAVASSCPLLSHVILAWCTEVNEGIASFAQCPHLQLLDLTGVKKLKTQPLTALLCTRAAAPNLQLLSLKQCNLVDDKAIISLKETQRRHQLLIINYYGLMLGDCSRALEGNSYLREVFDAEVGYFSTDIMHDILPETVVALCS